jgi:hypothetical protein
MSTDDNRDKDVVGESGGPDVEATILKEYPKTLMFTLNADRMDKLFKVMEDRDQYLTSDTLSELIDEEIQRTK